MAEPITWLPDGTPYSPRFQDRYRSELGGLSQAREVFLQGCGLPEAWAGQPQWRILETGFGLGLNFLVTWDAWRRDPAHPRLLHFVSIEAWPASADDLLRSFAAHPELLPLAEQLHARWWGLLPGWHRLVFEDGQVVLTLCIGEAQAMLREMNFEADAVYLDGFSPDVNPDIWSPHTMKAVARCCRRGARVASWTVARGVRDGLAQAGFTVRKTEGVPPKRHNLQGVYDPHWEPRQPAGVPMVAMAPSRCMVIGAGIAGASVAHGLARRGWQVTVLDAANTPAAGASGLPAGLVAPHVSAGDSVLSQLSRAGVRATLQLAAPLLRAGIDWAPDGVLQRHLEGAPALPTDATTAGREWSTPASPEQLAAAGAPAESAAHWHARGGWLRPRRLVEVLLAHPAVTWQGGATVARLETNEGTWQALDADGRVLAEAPLVVLATSIATGTLAGVPLPLQPVRGQVTYGSVPEPMQEGVAATPGGSLPPFPVNGHGSFISGVPVDGGNTMWVAGASFDRHQATPHLRDDDRAGNLKRLAELLPTTAEALAPAFEHGGTTDWAGVRCASADRMPLVGPLDPSRPGLWACTAMGSRGLTLAMLCAELLAARLHAEPLPLPRKLAAALDASRFADKANRG
ncbi:MAG: FAD-dependent cmnm(5)s(2)U34 oxidoreductase [Rhodoferax sp.]|nr:FAD-dependent cmnm(5)s(2)U34 oxidoreductase [Rhodoferax sp.]